MIKNYFVSILLLCSLSLSSQDSTHVLFIGNSYTYFWNLPQVVQSLAHSQNIPLTTAQSTIGGANLGQHWDGARGLKSHEKLENTHPDYVVLQDHSMRSIQVKDSLDYFVDKWVAKIKNEGGLPVLYMTWARAFNPLMQEPITVAYEDLAIKHNVRIAPVGKVWELARHLNQDLELYDQDGSHPAPLGTYLTALTFYKILTGRTVKGLPNRLVSKDENGEKIYLMIVPGQEASFCQDVVEKIFKDYPLAQLNSND